MDNTKVRYFILDEIRGLCIFCMVFYHAFYTMSSLFNISMGATLFEFFKPVEPFFAGIFILISGLCCNLSHSNLLRGLKLFGIALLLSLVTYFIGNGCFISFGILHMLSVCMTLFGVLEPAFKKIKPEIGIIVSIIFYVVTIPVTLGSFGIRNIAEIKIPGFLYDIGIFFPFGIYNSHFYSADYFPLFPWMFIFFLGAFLGRGLLNYTNTSIVGNEKETYSKLLYENNVPFLSFMGRHSLLIYIVHQPAIYLTLFLVGLFIK